MNPLLDQRFRILPVLAVTCALSVVAACGKKGGSGDSVQPSLLAAAFVGVGPSPTAGDRLVLSFSEDVNATLGAGADDADFTLSGGGTLGTGTTVLDQPTTRTLRLQLGTGASFTPGSTTIGVAATNDVFADLAGNRGDATTTVVIDTSDGAAPTIGLLTIANVDAALNGTGAAGGVLQAPTTGWTVNLRFADTGAGALPALGVDTASTRITANVGVSTASGSQPAGTDLAPFLGTLTATATTASYALPATTVFPATAITLTAVVFDNGGLSSSPATFSFTVRAFTTTTQPFETNVNSQQVWFLDTSRDIESFSTSPTAGGATVNVSSVTNGRSDYLDILFVLGMQSATPIPNVSGGLDSNQVARQLFEDAIIANLDGFFGGTKVAFTFTAPSGSFGGNSSVPYANLGYSQICLAGSAETTGVLGIAQLDPNNQRQNNDCLLESATTSRLGVFLHTMADTGLAPPSTSRFRQAFDAICPATGGTAIGNTANDGSRLLDPNFDGSGGRAARMHNAIDDLARFVAIVAAHECGHSMGLVVNGAMPAGLYGGDPTHFPGSTDGHIATPLLFPLGTNIMSPQLGYSTAINAATGFNSLNLAYLREQVFYGN